VRQRSVEWSVRSDEGAARGVRLRPRRTHAAPWWREKSAAVTFDARAGGRGGGFLPVSGFLEGGVRTCGEVGRRRRNFRVGRHGAFLLDLQSEVSRRH